MINIDLNKDYKQLRNSIREFELLDSLSVVRAYSQNLQINERLPVDIDLGYQENPFLLNDQIQKKRMLSEWELESLTRELIMHAKNQSCGTKSLKKWNNIALVINKLKNLENNISGVYVNKDNILSEFFRISHRQFPWQEMIPSSEIIIRYYKIYNHVGIDNIARSKYGLGIYDIYIIGLLFFGVYLNKFALFYPPEIQLRTINKENIDKFLSIFSCDLDLLREKYKSEHTVDSGYAYNSLALRFYPLIRCEFMGRESLICPIPTLLMWRYTSGLFYDLINERNFGQYYGESFEKYIGDVISASLTDGFKEFPEQKYRDKAGPKKSSDWIINKSRETLFIECKTKRLKARAKSELDLSTLNSELDILANSVLQLYKSIIDFLDEKFLTEIKKDRKKIYLLVVTMEDWFILGDNLKECIDKAISKKIKESDLPSDIEKEMPYSMCSVGEFEILTQVINKVGISKFMETKIRDKEKMVWAFRSYMNNDFKKEVTSAKFLFNDEYKDVFNIKKEF